MFKDVKMNTFPCFETGSQFCISVNIIEQERGGYYFSKIGIVEYWGRSKDWIDFNEVGIKCTGLDPARQLLKFTWVVPQWRANH